MNEENSSREDRSERPEPLYTSLVAARNTELTVYWSRNNILSAINFGLVAVAFTSKSDSFANCHHILVGLFGSGLAAVWLLFVYFGKRLLRKQWEDRIRTYENATLPSEHRLFTNILAEQEKNPVLRWWNNLTILTMLLPCICIAVWAAFALNGCVSLGCQE